MTTLAPKVSVHGFKSFPPVDSDTGGVVEVYDASDTERFWLHVTGLANPDDGLSGVVEVTAKLTLANLAVLRDQLTYLIEHAND